MNKLGIIFLIAAFFPAMICFGQSTKTNKTISDINNVIQELFDGYRAGDSARVHAVFTTDAQVQTIFTSDDNIDKISNLISVDGFIKYIGGGLSEVHDERLWNVNIYADHQLGTVWTEYAFFLGEKYIHCGTETFLLRKENSHWRIFYLVDTRHKSGCKLPNEIK